MSERAAYILLYSANLVFIVTHLYGWLLKWFYRPKAYLEDFQQLFPAYREVGVLYLMQVMEIPYLLQIGDRNALLYVNAFAVLFYSLQMLVMCQGYFFTQAKRRWRDYLAFLPAVLILLPLLLQALHVVTLPAGHRLWTFVGVSIVFAVYFWMSVRMALRIGRAVKQVNEASYADRADFPVRLAQYLQWVPTIVCVMMAVNFYADSAPLKAVRDVWFSLVSVWFCIFTLNPRRKVFTPQEEEIIEQIERTDDSAFLVNDDRFDEMRDQLDRLMTDDHIFTEPHITIDTLVARLSSNPKYIAEVIKRSGYQSFYDMICRHRVNHAIKLISEHPDEKLFIIAEQCGFSSPSSMTRAFKQQGKPVPSTFRTKQE